MSINSDSSPSNKMPAQLTGCTPNAHQMHTYYVRCNWRSRKSTDVSPPTTTAQFYEQNTEWRTKQKKNPKAHNERNDTNAHTFRQARSRTLWLGMWCVISPLTILVCLSRRLLFVLTISVRVRFFICHLC